MKVDVNVRARMRVCKYECVHEVESTSAMPERYSMQVIG